jgi:hypothetical protein
MSRSIKGNKQAVKALYASLKGERYQRTIKHVNIVKQATTE